MKPTVRSLTTMLLPALCTGAVIAAVRAAETASLPATSAGGTATAIMSAPAHDAAPARVPQERATRPIVIASKPFAESYILAEMFAQLLEARGLRVDRRPGLGATELAFRALRTGAIDVYPEYTGTGLLAILNEPPQRDARAVFRHVATVFPERFGVHWLPPLGFENTYAIAVTRATAEQHGLRTLTDLARAAPRLTAGFTPDFVGRPDGLPGLQNEYGMRFRAVRSLLQSIKYNALVSGSVHVVDGYSTDGAVARHELIVLEDDRRFFPPYEAAALVGPRLVRDAPHAIAALGSLSGRIDASQMRRWNERVEGGGEEVAAVATDALKELGLIAAPAGGITAPTRSDSADPATGAAPVPVPGSDTPAARARDPVAAASDDAPLWRYFFERRALLLQLTLRHLLLVTVSLGSAILIAIPLGLALERTRAAAETVIRAAGVLQTIPGIALLAFMIPLFGIGIVPALVALLLYSLYPIVRNTFTGVRDAAPDAVNAAGALGMTTYQVLRYVRMPLAAPIIMAGVRTAAVIGVGTATLAAFIGAGGLGDPIVAGLALSDTRMILLGALPAALLALLVDALLGVIERRLRPSFAR